MIRNFQDTDARRLKANKFSNLKESGYLLENPEIYKNTLVGENSAVHAIIGYARYWENCFAAFFFISDDLTIKGIKELKEFIYQAADDMAATRIQTESICCPELTRWHEFLGFKSEGVRIQMAYEKDYEMWALLKGRDF